MTAVDQARAELRRLRGSWDYAFAHASSCTWGCDPRLAWVQDREQRLVVLIRDLEATPSLRSLP